MNSTERRTESISLLSTSIYAKRFTREKWLSQALYHARLANELHDEEHMRQAVRLRGFAQGLTLSIERSERVLERMNING